MGFDAFIDVLRSDYLLPIAQLLYPEQVGSGLDFHRAFVVKYTMAEDVELSYHFDNAEGGDDQCLPWYKVHGWRALLWSHAQGIII